MHTAHTSYSLAWKRSLNDETMRDEWIRRRARRTRKISENKTEHEGKRIQILKKAMSECSVCNQEVAFRFFPLSEPLNLRLRY